MKYQYLFSLIALILLLMACMPQPSVHAAGVPFTMFGFTNNTPVSGVFFSETEAKPGDTAGAETEDIQQFAKRQADQNESDIAAGRQTPELPATAANLGLFQNRDKLPEEQRQKLEPTGGDTDDSPDDDADDKDEAGDEGHGGLGEGDE